MKNATPKIPPLITPFRAALKTGCPHCGEGRLFDGVLTPAKSCSVCELDYSFIDSGDGPAVFVIFILGFIVLGLALVVENSFHPPIWVHGLLWSVVTALASIWALRFSKALLIAIQYKTKAAQAKL